MITASEALKLAVDFKEIRKKENIKEILNKINNTIISAAKQGYTCADIKMNTIEDYEMDILKELRTIGYKCTTIPEYTTLHITWHD